MHKKELDIVYRTRALGWKNLNTNLLELETRATVDCCTLLCHCLCEFTGMHTSTDEVPEEILLVLDDAEEVSKCCMSRRLGNSGKWYLTCWLPRH